jgi:hypothetical protein
LAITLHPHRSPTLAGPAPMSRRCGGPGAGVPGSGPRSLRRDGLGSGSRALLCLGGRWRGAPCSRIGSQFGRASGRTHPWGRRNDAAARPARAWRPGSRGSRRRSGRRSRPRSGRGRLHEGPVEVERVGRPVEGGRVGRDQGTGGGDRQRPRETADAVAGDVENRAPESGDRVERAYDRPRSGRGPPVRRGGRQPVRHRPTVAPSRRRADGGTADAVRTGAKAPSSFTDPGRSRSAGSRPSGGRWRGRSGRRTGPW